ncbi:3964_t:CDS:2, partial [Dentiscutata erythropus]
EEKIDQLNIIFANMNAAQVQQSPITQVVPKPLIMPHSVPTSNRCVAIQHSKYVDSENNLEIVNPPVTYSRRETKRYKSATEKTHRQPYACRTCGQVGHNSARCEKKSN